VKRISIFRRRAGMSQEEFIRHYETVHAPMAYAHYRFAKYVRNHIEACLVGRFDFDVLVEIYPDTHHPQRVLPRAVLQAFADDRRFFIDAARIGGPVAEVLVSGPPRQIDPIGASKFCIALHNDRRTLLPLLSAESRHEGIERITTDHFTEEDGSRPFAGLVWLWAKTLSDGLVSKIAARRDVEAILHIRPCETSAHMLRAMS
jgi:hypothetical protein